MVHGYYSKLISKQQISQLKYPKCDAEYDMQFETFCKIHHMLFIPFVAGKKTPYIGCGKCGTHYYPTAFPAFEQQAIEFAKQTKKRWYHFSGLMLLSIFVIGAVTLVYKGSQENKKRMDNNLAAIQPNCVIFYHKAEDVNTSMLVSRVVADTVFVHENSRSTNGSAYQIDDSDNYKGPETFFMKSELKKWLAEGKINDITEPQTYAE
ncbi:hypothetical protein OQZ29_07415 [Pedobacter agri]|uniref:Zinc-ribbon 15 domain-containing protein n=2 Tax=Pedobacter agri TaxID=454586 RepID=A0A9X3I893_9SPHI|nr:hypothetical protein [Pedobacter agri]MCX3264567.1 hypothetical protein [Pedobacter agri]